MLRRFASVYLVFAIIPCGLAHGAEPLRFSRDILPILSDACFHCHGPDPKHREADLRLDDRAAAVEHGAFVPGKADESEILRRMTSTDPDERMPPPASNRSVTKEQIEKVRRWIDEGAAWGKPWAYEAPVRLKVPPVKASGWPQNPIDAFVLERLQQEKLKPSPEADAATLCRRVYLDLTGLPPTPEEVAAFVQERNYDRLVEKLLASPRYGERWAWEWLDAARYADTNGFQGDPERTMWPWRDWVIRAINDNISYDRFTIEQLAGDLLPDATDEQRLATAFNRNHMHNGEGGRIGEETRVENVMDRTETTATVWLGLTLGCARCHDHKYDPLTNVDYYRFYAYFNNSSENGTASGGGRTGQIKPVLELSSPEETQALAAVEKSVALKSKELEAFEKDFFAKTSAVSPDDPPAKPESAPKQPELSKSAVDALKLKPSARSVDALREIAEAYKKSRPDYAQQLTQLRTTIDERNKTTAKVPRVMVMDDLPTPRESFVLVRGAYDKPSTKVTQGLPGALPPLPKGSPDNRLGLARWLVEPSHPLTARVTVNRYWQSFFGTGLVRTSEDFGVQGEAPSHPELLDWLAVEFRDSGWDVKGLHKLIVTSAAYKQSSRVTPLLWERDPDNRLLARGPRHRLPSWMLRDQALAISGLLVEKQGGPPVKPYQPDGIWEEATFGKKSYVQDHGEALYRRSLYIFWRRIVGPTMFFDTSARQVCTIKTSRTNTPLHALTTLNDVTYVEAARALAERVLKDAKSDEAKIAAAFQRATARRPTTDEVATLRKTLAQLRKQYQADVPAAEKLLQIGESPRDKSLNSSEHAAYMTLCLLILNLDEVLTKQ